MEAISLTEIKASPNARLAINHQLDGCLGCAVGDNGNITFFSGEEMSVNSVLLVLDGTAQCLKAAEFIWELAQGSVIRVNAQFVVDSPGIWEFLNYDLPGFIGSGPYLNAHENIRNEVNSLGETLIDVYKTRAESVGVQGDAFIDEGNPVREISRRAQDHDLVVIGNRTSGITSIAADRRRRPRYSLAENLAINLQQPLLIVQDSSRIWNGIDVYVNASHEFRNILDACCALADWQSADINVFSCREDTEDIDGQMKLHEYLEVLRCRYLETKLHLIDTDVQSVKGQVDSRAHLNNLAVLSAFDKNGHRYDAVGLTIDQVVRYSSAPSILIWPEYYRLGNNKKETGVSETLC